MHPGLPGFWRKVSSCFCLVGLHRECVNPEQNGEYFACCCTKTAIKIEPDRPAPAVSLPNDEETKKRVRALKENEKVTDVLSTGRKRAVASFPITPGMLCEWSFLKFAGGGPIPIIGCGGNEIGHVKNDGGVHHGPDKNTLNNEPGNVHRVCRFCHNRWHTLNDPFYGKRPENGEPFLPLSGKIVAPHDSETLCTVEEINYSETWWALPEKERGPYRKDPAQNE